MNGLPTKIDGSEVTVILRSGDELNGICKRSCPDGLMIDTGGWEWYIDDDDILAIGVKKPEEGA
jgi:hypothetical protein